MKTDDTKQLIISYDPGANGCMVIFNRVTLEITFYDFKHVGLKGYINALKSIDLDQIHIAAIELVRARPGQGVSSMLSLGRRVGELEGMLQTLDIGYIELRPQEWQKTCGVVPKSGKKGIYETISKIYPKAELKGSRGGLLDGRCDALGIAHYLRKTYP